MYTTTQYKAQYSTFIEKLKQIIKVHKIRLHITCKYRLGTVNYEQYELNLL